MKRPHLIVLPLLAVFALPGAFGAPALIEGFACPQGWPEGAALAGTDPAEGRGNAGWALDQNEAEQVASAFVIRNAAPFKITAPAKTEEAPAADAEDKSGRGGRAEREARAKERARAEAVEKGVANLGKLRRVPGLLSLEPGQKTVQHLVLPLEKPLEPPFFMSFLVTWDPQSSGNLEIGLEDEVVDMPFKLRLAKPAENAWQVRGAGMIAYLNAGDYYGEMFVLAKIEPHAKERGKWQLSAVINPPDLRDPFKSDGIRASTSGEIEPKPLVRLRVMKGGKAAGTLDEIRIGNSLRDVLP
jgi:hypothetical protein